MTVAEAEISDPMTWHALSLNSARRWWWWLTCQARWSRANTPLTNPNMG